MSQKVLLIRSPCIVSRNERLSIFPPLGLAYISAVLQREGHTVGIIDAAMEDWKNRQRLDVNFDCIGLSLDNIKKRIATFEPDVIGVSWQYSGHEIITKKILELAKETCPEAPVVVGGAHASAAPSSVMNNKNINYVVIGEGEATFSSFVKKYEGDESFEELDGFAYRKQGKICINHKTRFIDNLDSLPFPALNLLPMEKYFEYAKERPDIFRRNPFGTVVTSRGCPYDCVFCSIHCVWGYRWRARSPKNVVDEIKHLIEQYGVKEIHFLDDNLTLDPKRAGEIFDSIIEQDLDITWRPPNGIAIHTVTKDLLIKMKKSGCYKISLGLESGDPHMLNKVIRKKYTIEQARKVVKWIKDLGIETDGFFILGVPGETKETVHDTINFAKELDLDSAAFFLAQPYPGTELYEICEKEGYLRVKELFQLRTSSSSIETPLLSQKDLELLQKIANGEFMFKKITRLPYQTLRGFTRLNNFKSTIFVMGSYMLARLQLARRWVK